MRECDNSKTHTRMSSNFLLSISLIIMFETLLLLPSLYCNEVEKEYRILQRLKLSYSTFESHASPFNSLSPNTVLSAGMYLILCNN